MKKKVIKPAAPEAPKMTAAQKALWDKLNHSQRKMGVLLLQGKSALAAYREVKGDSIKSKPAATVRVLAHDTANTQRLRAWLDAMQMPVVNAAIMTRTEALERLTTIARTSLSDIIDFSEVEICKDDNGEPLIQATWRIKNKADIDTAKLAVISELSAGREGIKIKTHSPLAAIKQLGELEGWEAPKKLDHTSSDGSMTPAKEISDEQLKEKLRELGIGRKSGQLDERSQ